MCDRPRLLLLACLALPALAQDDALQLELQVDTPTHVAVRLFDPVDGVVVGLGDVFQDFTLRADSATVVFRAPRLSPGATWIVQLRLIAPPTDHPVEQEAYALLPALDAGDLSAASFGAEVERVAAGYLAFRAGLSTARQAWRATEQELLGAGASVDQLRTARLRWAEELVLQAREQRWHGAELDLAPYLGAVGSDPRPLAFDRLLTHAARREQGAARGAAADRLARLRGLLEETRMRMTLRVHGEDRTVGAGQRIGGWFEADSLGRGGWRPVLEIRCENDGSVRVDGRSFGWTAHDVPADPAPIPSGAPGLSLWESALDQAWKLWGSAGLADQQALSVAIDKALEGVAASRLDTGLWPAGSEDCFDSHQVAGLATLALLERGHRLASEHGPALAGFLDAMRLAAREPLGERSPWDPDFELHPAFGQALPLWALLRGTVAHAGDDAYAGLAETCGTGLLHYSTDSLLATPRGRNMWRIPAHHDYYLGLSHAYAMLQDTRSLALDPQTDANLGQWLAFNHRGLLSWFKKDGQGGFEVDIPPVGPPQRRELVPDDRLASFFRAWTSGLNPAVPHPQLAAQQARITGWDPAAAALASDPRALQDTVHRTFLHLWWAGFAEHRAAWCARMGPKLRQALTDAEPAGAAAAIHALELPVRFFLEQAGFSR